MKYVTIFGLSLLLLLCLSVFTFRESDNYITGKQIIGTKLSIINISYSECVLNLTAGWNVISLYCAGMITPRETVLAGINSNYSAIFTYDAFDSVDPWKSYNPSLPTWTVQQLNYVDRFSGYYVYMRTDKTFYYNGTKKSSTIQLAPGWNLIGYPSISSRSVNDTLENISYTILKTYNSTSGDFLIYEPSGIKEFEYMDVYKAYWINSSASQSIYFTGE